MSLWSLEIFLLLQRGDRLSSRRQILTTKVYSRGVRGKIAVETEPAKRDNSHLKSILSADQMLLGMSNLHPVEVVAQGSFSPWNTELFLHKSWRLKGFLIWNHYIHISYLFPIHLNAFVMGLRSLETFLLLQRGDWL